MPRRKAPPRPDAVQATLKEEARAWGCVLVLLAIWGALSHWMG